MMESLLRDGRSNIVIKFINDHDAKDHDHLNDHQVRWEGPECDGSHMSLKPWALPSCQKQWKLVLPSGLITLLSLSSPLSSSGDAPILTFIKQFFLGDTERRHTDGIQ